MYVVKSPSIKGRSPGCSASNNLGIETLVRYEIKLHRGPEAEPERHGALPGAQGRRDGVEPEAESGQQRPGLDRCKTAHLPKGDPKKGIQS